MPLEITIHGDEQWDEVNERFIPPIDQTLKLEHSLVSLSKWEQRWHKPFMTDEEKTIEETIDYIKCMTITQNVDQNVYTAMSKENVNKVLAYIQDPMTATVITRRKKGKINNEQITAELIYYWMITLNIPPEYRKWHLNTLITLIEVCNIKNQPPEKMTQNEIMRRNAELNAKRRAAMHSKG